MLVPILHLTLSVTAGTRGQTASSILGSILSIQPKDSSSGSGETREATVYRLAEDMLEKLPNDYVPFEVQNRLVKMGTSD